MTKKHEFQLQSQERVDGLTSLLSEILPQLGLRAQGHAWREITGPDFAEHDLLRGSRVIGHYNFERMSNGRYNIVLELNGLPSDIYETLLRTLSPRFPEIQFPAYTG